MLGSGGNLVYFTYSWKMEVLPISQILAVCFAMFKIPPTRSAGFNLTESQTQGKVSVIHSGKPK